MATKPNETYKWGESATHEQVAAYEDTGWPSDAIPPKRTQFNWYQNLVGRWLGWLEGKVDDIVETVLDAWFVEIPDNTALWPNKSGIYHVEGASLVFMVEDMFALSIHPLGPNGISIGRRFWTGSEWGASSSFTRANTRADILQESEANYVTPKGLVDYFKVDNTVRYQQPTSVPHQSGVYFIRPAGSFEGVSIVIDDTQAFISFSQVLESASYIWDGSSWVLQ